MQTILKLPPQSRSTDDIQALMTFTADIELFKQLNDESSSEAHVKCCRFMHYEYADADAVLFDYANAGDKFYIILDGTVKVQVPSTYEEGAFQEVGVLGRGQSFGELALTKDMPRAARIVCISGCHFATLHSQDFKRILGRLTEQMLDRRVAFLQELPVFSFWTKQYLVKLSYYFKELKFSRKQVVFQQDSLSSDIYFIKGGEFQLSKNLKQTNSKTNHICQRKAKSNLKAQIALLGFGEFFGDDDALADRPRSTTCVCHSTSGALIAISKDAFMQRLSDSRVADYLKARSESQDWSRLKRIQDFSALVANGHLPPETKSQSPQNLTVRRQLYSRSRMLQETSVPHNISTSALFKTLDSKASPPRLPTMIPRESSLSRISHRPNYSLDLKSIVDRLQKSSKSQQKSQRQLRVVNIHTRRSRKRPAKHLSMDSQTSEGLVLSQSTAHLTRRMHGPPISIMKFACYEEPSLSPDKQRPASRMHSTGHSMFRLLKQL
jgi:CRP-like cAMP-binding protein